MQKLLTIGYTKISLSEPCFTCVIQTELPQKPLLISDGLIWMLGETTRRYDAEVAHYLEQCIQQYKNKKTP